MQKLTKTGTWSILILTIFFHSSFCIAAKNYPTVPYPVIDYPKIKNPELVKKGEYLAKAGDCIACHTDTDHPGSPIFAGGLGVDTPFGTFFTPNITPDKETGIGKWSDKDFIKAMHDGLNPHNENYFPVFPYVFFNRVSKEDLIAIKAYLDQVPAVNYTPPKNQVSWPFNVRLLQWGWKLLFFLPDSGYFKEDPKQSKQWNRGSYLVNGLEHCSMCHTPVNVLGSWKKSYFLAGGIVDNFPAPNITSSRLKDFSVQQVMDVFLKDQLLGGGRIVGPMLDVNHNSLRYLSKEDLESIVIYLKTVKSKEIPKPKIKSGAQLGEGIYDAYCATCHAVGSAGAPIVGDVLTWETRIKLGLPTLYHNAIDGINAMPAKGTCSSCTDQEIEAAVRYMVDESKPGAKASSSYTKIPTAMPAPTVNLAHGKEIYEQACSTCHIDGKFGAPKMGDKKIWAAIIKQNMDVLFGHTIQGYKAMPPRGNCTSCSDTDLMDAVIYMVQQNKEEGDFILW